METCAHTQKYTQATHMNSVFPFTSDEEIMCKYKQARVKKEVCAKKWVEFQSTVCVCFRAHVCDQDTKWSRREEDSHQLAYTRILWFPALLDGTRCHTHSSNPHCFHFLFSPLIFSLKASPLFSLSPPLNLCDSPASYQGRGWDWVPTILAMWLVFPCLTFSQ